jgi:hypothetical protein
MSPSNSSPRNGNQYGALVVKISKLQCKRIKLKSIQGGNQEHYTTPTKYSFTLTLKQLTDKPDVLWKMKSVWETEIKQCHR